MKSDQISTLAAALNKAQSALKPALKDGTNPHFRSQYATLQSVWDAAHSVLTPNGLSVVQSFAPCETGDVLHITTTLLHNSGEWIDGTLSIKPSKADPQGIGSAITYGRRYALAAILGIVADEDDDGNAASAPAPKAKPAPYVPHGPMITPNTKGALVALSIDRKVSAKLDSALAAKGILTFEELSEEDAQKLLKWATS